MKQRMCDYYVSLGLIDMLSTLTSTSKQEVWSRLADETSVCINKIETKNIHESWRWVKFLGTEVRLKIKVNKYAHDRNNSVFVFRASIKMDANQVEHFTSRQVDDFLVGEILLGN